MAKFWSINPPIPPFVFFSVIHWITLGTITVITILIIVFLKKVGWKKANRNFELVYAIFLIAAEIAYIIWIGSYEKFQWAYHLPLHLCDSALIVCIFYLLFPKKNQVLFEVIYFTGLGGGTQALLTPLLDRFGFPHFVFFVCFIFHSALLIVPLYFVFVRGCKVTITSLIRFIFIMNGYLVFVLFTNWVIRFLPPSYEGGNYLFLSSPPATGSLIDFLVDIFGPSPGYILGLELLGMFICLILWVPFGVLSFVGKRTEKKVSQS